MDGHGLANIHQQTVQVGPKIRLCSTTGAKHKIVYAERHVRRTACQHAKRMLGMPAHARGDDHPCDSQWIKGSAYKTPFLSLALFNMGLPTCTTPGSASTLTPQ